MEKTVLSKIICFEFRKEFYSKQFWLTVIIMPAIFLCVFLLNKGQQRTCRLAIYNQSSIEHPIKSSTFFEALYLESANRPQLFLNDSTDYNGLLLINEKNDQLFATLYSTPQKINLYTIDEIRNQLALQLADKSLNGLIFKSKRTAEESIIFDVKYQNTSQSQYIGIIIISIFIVYFLIFQFSGKVMSSISIEKGNKIAEILLSSSNAVNIVVGKILSGFALAFTQVLLWIIFCIAEIWLSVEFLDLITMNFIVDYLHSICETLPTMKLLGISSVFVMCLLGGYLLYSSLYAIIGAMSNENKNSQQLTFVITTPLLLTFVFVFQHLGDNNMVMNILSYIPLTSPLCLLARLLSGIQFWNLIISFILLFVTDFVCIKIASSLYRKGITSDDSRTSFKELGNCLFHKKG